MFCADETNTTDLVTYEQNQANRFPLFTVFMLS